MARIDLTEIELNPPWRMNDLDPLDKPHVVDLANSIMQQASKSGKLEDGVHGRTGGISLRYGPDDVIECVTRRHLICAAILAAKKLGVEPVLDIKVDRMSEEDAAIRCATENSTQRGGIASAQMAISAMATQQILKTVLGGNVPQVHGTFPPRAIETMRGQIASPKGLGADAVWDWLEKNVPGVTHPVVQSFFAAVKASGEYDRLVAGVMKSIGQEGKTPARLEVERAEADLEEAQEAQTRAPASEKRKAPKEKVRQARDRVKRVAKVVETEKPREVTFDAGVAAVLQDIPCLNTFRHIVTHEPIKSMIAVKDQVGLAQQIVADAKSQGRGNVTALFIRLRIGVLVQGLRTDVSKSKREEFKTADAARVLKEYADLFARTLRSLQGNALKLVEHLEKHKGIKIEMPGSLPRDVKILFNIADRLNKLMDGDATPASVIKLIAHQKG